MDIKAKINISKVKEILFYLRDSHEAYLQLAKRHCQNRFIYFQAAQRCRKHYAQVRQFLQVAR